MDYSLLAVLFLAVGLTLLVAEVFIPSGGFILILVLSSLGASLYCAWQQWGVSSPHLWWLFLLTVVLAIPCVLAGSFYILPKTRFGSRVLLEAPRPEEVAPWSRDREHLSQLVGQRGRTLTMLNPGGLASVGGERVHCESVAGLLDAGAEIEVVEVRGNRVAVRPVSSTVSAETASADGTPPAVPPDRPTASTSPPNGSPPGTGSAASPADSRRETLDDPFQVDFPDTEPLDHPG